MTNETQIEPDAFAMAGQLTASSARHRPAARPKPDPRGPTCVLAAGVGLKPEHYGDALQCGAPGLWFEVHPENYMVEGGPRLAWLEAMRAVHPLSLHGVSLSLGGADPPDEAHLQQLRALIQRFEPALVSEHLAWSRLDGVYFPDLLPVPRDDAALKRLTAHIDHAQTVLGRRIALENPSHYLRLPEHDWPEIEFLTALARRTGCGLLLDVNNVFVSANNLGFCAADYVDRFPAEAVTEIHLAGHAPDPNLGQALLIDSHDTAIAPGVWALYERLIHRIGARPTLIERDGNLPAFEQLMREHAQADLMLQRLGDARHAAPSPGVAAELRAAVSASKAT